MKVFWSIRDWVSAIIELPVQAPLPCRTVLVPNERVAHALRRELIRTGHAEVLAGSRFVTTILAATEVLRAGGIAFTPGEEHLRATRLRIMFQGALPLRYFSSELLRTALGWDEAFARTIGDLESAGLSPDDLGGNEDTRIQDVATIWRASQDSAGNSWSSARILVEAARLLHEQSALWSFDGPVLAALSGDLTAAQSGFVRAIPGVTLAIHAARPIRTHYLERLRRLFGDDAATAVAGSSPARDASNERAILASFLFERPDVLADPERPRSNGIDGTVHLEEHAGLEAELEAAADWVAQQVLERNTPVEDIAVLMPMLEPMAGLLVERLDRLPGLDGEFPVHVAGGLPVTATGAGARVLAVIRALRSGLAVDALADVLPALRTTNAETRHLSRGAAMDLAYSLGTVGGSAANLQGALEWSPHAAVRERTMEAWLARTSAVEDSEEQAGHARSKRDFERLLADLRAIRPALDALVSVAAHVVAEAPLSTLWQALRTFLEQRLLAPGSGAPVWTLLDEALVAACSDKRCAELAGDAALDLIERTLATLHVRAGRFGDPALYIGTIRGAAGIPFRAVRVIGLTEGALPSSPREDPVLPEGVRQKLSEGRIPTTADHVVAEIHALDRALRDATGSIVLSAPRLSAERTDRESSSIFIEAAAALGRPNSETGKHERIIPDRTALERDAFAPARRERRAFRTDTPLAASAWLERAARSQRDAPGAWRGSAELDLDRVVSLLSSAAWNGLDGLIGTDGPVSLLPGLTPERPISASALRTLLQCPHLFLFERVLWWGQPAAPPALREIEPLAYGGLFHRVAEAFFREHGERFGARRSTLPDWHSIGEALVDQCFDEFCGEYPLVGEPVKQQQRFRLRRDFRHFLDYDWNSAARRQFVAVEKPFGIDEGLEIALDDGALFVRGFIDRVDVEDGRALVRDLKSGRSHPRIGDARDPDPHRDIQLALYGLVARQLAAQWGIPTKVAAAYAYAESSSEPERSFRRDFDDLEKEASRWLSTARQLLHEGVFPRTPDHEDCGYCAFQPVCGPDANKRANTLLENAAGALAAFRAIKIAEEQ